MFAVTDFQDIPQQGNLQHIKESRHNGTLLFTPGLRTGTAVNVVLYLHGNMFSGFEALRQRVFASVGGAGKALAFAMPRLPDIPGTNDWITTRADFESFLDGVLLAVGELMNEQAAGKCLIDRDEEWNRFGPTGGRVAPATLGNLIIAAHSGGGFPMWSIVNNHSGRLANLKELWFFDCLYAGMDQPWIQWARRNGSVTMDLVYTVQPPSETSATLARSVWRAARGKPPIMNIRSAGAEPSNNHNDVPPNNIGRLIRASSNL